VIAEIGVADQVTDGPLEVEELAKRTGTNADALYRVLRAVASKGVFTVWGFQKSACAADLGERGNLRHRMIVLRVVAPAVSDLCPGSGLAVVGRPVRGVEEC
jgi:hypothetical protein